MQVDWKPPRAVPVQDWLYPDRGMVKWQGFILSDHHEVMDFEAAFEAARDLEPSAERQSWDVLLQSSLEHSLRLKLWLYSELGTEQRLGRVEQIQAQGFCFVSESGRQWLDYRQVAGLQADASDNKVAP